MECQSIQNAFKLLIIFLTELADQGLSYSTIKATKSAILHINMGNPIFKDKNNLIKQFMKGVFKQRPSMPKYFSNMGSTNHFRIYENMGG